MANFNTPFDYIGIRSCDVSMSWGEEAVATLTVSVSTLKEITKHLTLLRDEKYREAISAFEDPTAGNYMPFCCDAWPKDNPAIPTGTARIRCPENEVYKDVAITLDELISD